MDITINDKGQINIPSNLKKKIEELGDEIHKSTAHMNHWERRGVIAHISYLLEVEGDKSYFRLCDSTS